MTDPKSTYPAPHDGDVTSPFAAVLAFNRPALEAINEVNSRFLKQIIEIHNAWAAFVQRRLDEDLAAAQRLAQCSSPQEWMHTFTEYIQTTQQDYQAEIAEFAKLGQTFSEDAVNLVRERIEDAIRKTET